MDSDSSSATRKIVKVPNVKRNNEEKIPVTEKVKLERVLGLTVPANAALDCDPNNGIVAYPAGCTVVLLNTRKSRQSYVQNASRKTVTCVAFSSCGRFLATGECGHTPAVRVWDLADKAQVGEFSGHKFGVSCVAFSPAQKYVVSVGSQHDMIVNVWDWRAGAKVASNKFSSKVKAVSFAENGSYFVTVGNRHVKFWYLDVARGHKFKEPVPLTGRSAILGEQRNNYFCDVACGRGEMGDSTFAITRSGLLCEFNNRRLLDKWVELRTSCANCVVAGEELIFVGCAEGIIRCFSPFNLQFITTLPRTHYLGVDVAQGLNIGHMASHPSQAKYPDTIAITLDETNRKVTAVYNDHSLYIWDVKDIKRVGKSHSYLYHSACIWGVEIYPSRSGSSKSHLPEGSFVTCSSDDTIRFWNMDPNMPTDTPYRKNIYSNELLKILYVDSELCFIKDTDVSPQGGADKTDGSYDSRNGVRCIKVSPDGSHLASGDRAGNIRIHDLAFNEEVCKIEAHDAEVLCLEYSKPSTGYKLLSSASRDRLIHVFNVKEDYNFIQTLDDHSSAITSVKFYQSQGNIQMVSCGADRSIIFREATQHPQSDVCFTRGHNVSGKTTLYDMEVDHGQRHILTACQDRNIRVYNVNSGKHSKTFKGSLADDGTLIKVVLDQSGIYAATSCTDKSICVYDYYSGECMAAMYGHSEIVTGLRFTADGKYLITVSGDGCVFVWSLPRDMTQIILARLAQQAERAVRSQREGRRSSSGADAGQPPGNGQFSPVSETAYARSTPEAEDPPDYRFMTGHLPLWAKKQMDQPPPPKTNGAGPPNPALDMPKGRWAQRLPNNPVTFKSHYDTDSTVPYPANEKRMESESSKESSLEEHASKAFGKPNPPPRKYSNKQPLLNSNALSPSPESPEMTGVGASIEGFRSPPGAPSGVRGAGLPVRRFGYPLTDDSDGGSLRVDGGGTTDHDGDIEDCSELDEDRSEHIVYYPASQDTAGEFTVNAMDVDELRRSQRRQHRKFRPERPTDIALASVSASQESDDDEEVSTPSADAAERNLYSMLAVSTENVERLGRRESFLKNNFESLNGPSDSSAAKQANNKNSISYKFNCRNREVTNTNKRQELLKRIEETRNKLKSIGYKSSLRSSKSISDLCNIPEKESPFISSHVQDGGSGDSGFSSATGAGYAGQAAGMRRACSLSDLTNPGAPKRLLPPPTVSGKKTNRAVKPVRSQASLSRSNSIGTLNQSEEEQPTSRASTATRHTISSMNKMTPRALKRKSSLSQAASTGDIRHLHEDSSSEDASPTDHKSARNRLLSADRRIFPSRAISERDLSRFGSGVSPQHARGVGPGGRFYPAAVQRKSTASGASDMSRPSSVASTADFSPEEFNAGLGFSRFDIDSAPLGVTLVESVCEWVVEGCERLSHLWWRTASEPWGEEGGDGDEDRQRALRSLLLGAAARATQALAPLNSPASFPPAPVPFHTDNKDPRVVAMMQQYTDMLVNMVQQKMAHQQPPPPGPA